MTSPSAPEAPSSVNAKRSNAPVVGAVVGVLVINLGILGYALLGGGGGVSTTPAPAPPAPVVASAAPVAPPAAAAPVAAPAPVRTPEQVAVVNPVFLPEREVIQGMYVQHCAACHGLTGRGDGPAANQLYPRPRDFVDSPFRFAPSDAPKGELEAALERTIAQGIPRSSMPGFRGVLTEPVIAGLANFVATLRAEQAKPRQGERLDLGTRPPTTQGMIDRGSYLFTSLGCVSCHGATGHGDGEGSANLMDSIGRPILPADLSSGLFKSGPRPDDICRVILKGIPGTPMVGYEAALVTTNLDGSHNLSDAWALVAFIHSLQARPESSAIPSGARIIVAPAPDPAMMLDPGHVGWMGVQPVEVEVKPLWQRPEDITRLAVRAVRDQSRLAICLEWHDSTRDLVKGQKRFSDAVSVMFSMSDEVPALPMGIRLTGHAPSSMVNLWHWQGHRQAIASEDSEVSSKVSPSSVTWKEFLLPEDKTTTAPLFLRAIAGEYLPLPMFRTAEQAGNVLADPELGRHSVLESNALGFGTLTLQAPSHQGVWGTAVWSAGVWRVVMVRSIEATQDDDVDFAKRSSIPAAFAVWDGTKGDRNGIKLISGWHKLILEEPSQNPSLAKSTTAKAGSIPERKTP
ncbi:c-type cytochrome [Candidatus Sumerlaeota bacterium]|nr:c-type cytochrome [Candidatus Sumerlaeota bacterium]